MIDGDTLQSGGDIVQLYGIDAPELGQLCWRKNEPWQCGVEAAFALQKLVQLSGLAVICESWHDATADRGPERRGHPRLPARRRRGPRHGAAAQRPRRGAAGELSLLRPARAPGQGRPGSASGAARPVPPWEWRDGARVDAGKSGKPAEACNVKGMLDDDGARIYLVPTDPDYDDASVDPAKGEQLFCSDEEARARRLAAPRRDPRAGADRRCDRCLA